MPTYKYLVGNRWSFFSPKISMNGNVTIWFSMVCNHWSKNNPPFTTGVKNQNRRGTNLVSSWFYNWVTLLHTLSTLKKLLDFVFLFQDTINKKVTKIWNWTTTWELNDTKRRGKYWSIFCWQLLKKDLSPIVGSFIKKLELIKTVASQVLSTEQSCFNYFPVSITKID